MKKKKQTLLDYMNKNNQINEKNWIFQIWVLLSELNKQKFVHCDVHLENILIENGDLFLIDFGLVMHEKYLMDSNQKSLYDLYLWSFEDFFSFIKNLIFYKKEAHLIKNNDYQKSRRTWRLFFQKNPKSWIKFKKLFITMFDFKEKDDYKICFHFFVNTILSDSPMISPKQGVYKYDILCNIFLDRMFLLFFIIHSPLLSFQRRRLYIHSLKLIHKIIN
jgi:serine/threonine protein kinase